VPAAELELLSGAVYDEVLSVVDVLEDSGEVGVVLVSAVTTGSLLAPFVSAAAVGSVFPSA